MANIDLSLYEQETIINFCEEEKTAGIYTHNKPLRRKLESLALDRPEDCSSSAYPTMDGRLITSSPKRG